MLYPEVLELRAKVCRLPGSWKESGFANSMETENQSQLQLYCLCASVLIFFFFFSGYSPVRILRSLVVALHKSNKPAGSRVLWLRIDINSRTEFKVNNERKPILRGGQGRIQGSPWESRHRLKSYSRRSFPVDRDGDVFQKFYFDFVTSRGN